VVVALSAPAAADTVMVTVPPDGRSQGFTSYAKAPDGSAVIDTSATWSLNTPASLRTFTCTVAPGRVIPCTMNGGETRAPSCGVLITRGSVPVDAAVATGGRGAYVCGEDDCGGAVGEVPAP
jgi:hypothetical protein